MPDKKILNQKRIRKITGSFSFLDHRIITGGFLDDLSSMGILLYFFLIAVSDRHGISFYHDDRICRILKLDLPGLGEARRDLMDRSLIEYRYPLYQVLALPDQPVPPPTSAEIAEIKRKKDLSYISKIRAAIGQRRLSC